MKTVMILLVGIAGVLVICVATAGHPVVGGVVILAWIWVFSSVASRIIKAIR